MITTPTVSGKPGQAPTGLSYDLYPQIGSHSTWTDPRGPVKLMRLVHRGIEYVDVSGLASHLPRLASCRLQIR